MLRFFVYFFFSVGSAGRSSGIQAAVSAGSVETSAAGIETGSFLQNGRTYDQPYFAVGNKRIGLRRLYGQDRADRDFIIGIQADGEEIFHIRFGEASPAGIPAGRSATLRKRRNSVPTGRNR